MALHLHLFRTANNRFAGTKRRVEDAVGANQKLATQNSKSKLNWIWRAPVTAMGCLNPVIGIRPEPNTGLIWAAGKSSCAASNRDCAMMSLLNPIAVARRPIAETVRGPLNGS